MSGDRAADVSAAWSARPGGHPRGAPPARKRALL